MIRWHRFAVLFRGRVVQRIRATDAKQARTLKTKRGRLWIQVYGQG